MISFANLRKAVMKTYGRTQLFYKAKKPTIYIGIGIACGVGAIVTACVATTKLNGVVEEHKNQADFIRSNTEEHERGKALTPVYLNTAKELVKIYAPSAALEGLSIFLIISGHNELVRRNAALAAAYMAVSESFKQYRQRVADDVGIEKEKEYYYGTKKQVSDGEKNEVTSALDTNCLSIYAQVFDKRNPNHHDDPNQSLLFLRCAQTTCNDILHAKGHLFLNEVYDMLGFPRTDFGQYVGWVDNPEAGGDCFVDFGIYNAPNNAFTNGDFIEGGEFNAILDFNVDGDIMYIFNEMFRYEYHDDLRDLWKKVKK